MEQKPGPIASALLAAATWYSKHSPIQKGKGLVQQSLLKLLAPIDLRAKGRDDAQFLLRFPDDHGWEALFFDGTFETGTTDLLARLLHEDDVVFDIGAN